MSSSQQQSTNSNNNQSQNPSHNPYDDYEYDSSISQLNNSNIYQPSSHTTIGNYANPIGQISYDINNDDDDDYDIPSDLEPELDGTDDTMGNEQINYNYQDETIFSDDVQNAFSNYENEYSKYWKQNEPNCNSFTDEEQEEMFEQMRECMLFMSQEYSTAEMPHNLVEITQESKLNPDAVEFRPSWPTASTSTANGAIAVTSWVPCEAKKQDEEQK